MPVAILYYELRNRWYLASLVKHLDWPGFLVNLLASCSLQLLSETKYEHLWAKVYDKPQPNTFKNKTSIVYLIFQYSQLQSEMWLLRWKRNVIVVSSQWSDDMDIETIEVFQKSHLGSKKVIYFDQLRHWQETDINKSLISQKINWKICITLLSHRFILLNENSLLES